MRRILRSFTIHLFVLWLVATNIGGIDYQGNFSNLAAGAAALTLAESLLKPVINLLLLPFNLVTLGVFRWVSSVITLYVATLLVPGFAITAFVYPGLSTNLFIIPQIQFSLITAYIVLSFFVSFVSSVLFWLAH